MQKGTDKFDIARDAVFVAGIMIGVGAKGTECDSAGDLEGDIIRVVLQKKCACHFASCVLRMPWRAYIIGLTNARMYEVNSGF